MDPTLRPGDERHELQRRAEEIERLRAVSERLGTSLADAFGKGAAEGGRFDRTLQGLRRSLVDFGLRMARAPLQQMIRQGVSTLIQGVGAGGFSQQGVVRPFAKGGVVASPTFFPMRGGAGLMGEAGPEAIMPLSRGPDGRLGVAAARGERPVSITVNIATPDAQSFRRSEAQVSAALARAVARGRRAM
ncbi:MAG: phage tail tape measure protein [Salinarimonadaceae bacterium]|nr:MAG: phage tail tape measure protein [Salinarimonadaceae bacterium]